MSKTLHYVFDPLCGWCYGASPALSALAGAPGVAIRLLPSGLFSGDGARPMDDDFAAFAWSNDQRIERLTGQRFTEHYRTEVLADRQQIFDSGPATVALTAVALTQPELELDTLRAVQEARYVEGQDITRLPTLIDVLRSLGLEQAAERLATPDGELLAANRARVKDAQALLQHVGAQGVPTFVLAQNGQRQLLHSSTVFSNPKAFLEQLAVA
ncbi:DsbA family protein [Xanthomonas citri]|uniref:DsbA family protein n=1 Tax=Xanthomonas citri TaxID=346 RepID=UPI0018858D7A|nr:DsbA family protein [Xanthomonas citri]MBE2321096.1 DsbA family protein [Solirubrobacter deserti]QOY21851.1 DsbA family protein [Xanthomonas citri]QQK67994.1 DsbA family protein [Xanthomonas citri]